MVGVAVEWGVRVEGSFVVMVADGLSAFREESARRAYGDMGAQAVYRPEGVERWFLVAWDSPLRPDPTPPPPQAGWWFGWRVRWGRNRSSVLRRRT